MSKVDTSKRRNAIVRERLLKFCRAGEPYPGTVVLTARLHKSMQKICYEMNHSPELKAWRLKTRKWHEVMVCLLNLSRARKPYPGRRALAAAHNCSGSPVGRAFKESAELREWKSKAGLRPGKRPKRLDVLTYLLERCRSGKPYPGMRALVYDGPCSWKRLYLAFKQSAELRRWRAGSEVHKGVSPKWPGIRDRLLKRYRSGEPYPGRAALAAEEHCSLNTIALPFKYSPELRRWEAKAKQLPGRRPKGEEVEEYLLEQCRQRKPYPGMGPLAARLRCSRNTVAIPITRRHELRDWQAGADLPKGPSPRWPGIRDRLLKLYRSKESYPGRRPLATRMRCSMPLIAHAFEESADLREWQAGSDVHGGPRLRRPGILKRLLKMCRDRKAYPGRVALACRLKCGKALIAILFKESSELRDWQAGIDVDGGPTLSHPHQPVATGPVAPPALSAAKAAGNGIAGRAETVSPETVAQKKHEAEGGASGFLGAMDLAKRGGVPKDRMPLLHMRLSRFRMKHGHDKRYVVEVEAPARREAKYLHAWEHVLPEIKDLFTKPSP